MRFVQIAVLLSVLCSFAGVAATKSAKTTQKSKAKSPAKKAPAKGKKAPAATWRTRQQSPTPDRYREIQQALATRGYLKNEPTGVWDAASVTAMQQFQQDQKLTPTGKITAPALIALGLGAKSAGAPPAQ